jgi:hypothetical protein
VSGLTLRDNSGFKNNGTLTNGPTWAVNQGKYALSFDGVNDHIKTPSQLTVTSAICSVSIWYMFPVSPSGDYPRILDFSDSTNSIQIVWDAGFGGNNLINTKHTQYQLGVNGTSWGASSTPTVGTWYHIAAVFDALASTTQVWINGVQQTGSASANIAGDSSSLGYHFWAIRRDLNAITTSNVILDDCMLYGTGINGGTAKTLSLRRGIAYEMAPRRRSSVQVTTNRLRRALIGS